MEDFRACFSDLPDPRAANARHDLLEVLFIALAALLCGAQGCSDMAEFGEAKESFLRGLLRLEHGIPKHDTFSRVLRLLDPQAFEAGRLRSQSHSRVSWQSTAKPCAAPLSVAAAVPHCTSSMFGQLRLALRSHNDWRRTATRSLLPWKSCSCCHSSIASSRLMPCTATRRWRRLFSTAVGSTSWPSRRTNQRCSPMPGSCWNPPPHLNKLSWRLSKAMDAKSSARPSWYSPIPWGPSTAFQVSRHWRGSSFGDASTAGTKSPWCGISPCRRPLRLLVCSPSCGPIGASRTNSIGC